MAPWVAMRKTTVYLPDDLKASLERRAAQTRRSEAEIIREGVRMAVSEGVAPLPHFDTFDTDDPLLSERVDELLEGFGQT